MGNGPSGFGSSSTAEQVIRTISLEGKNVIITGANSGIGKETARVMSLRKATVFMACRDKKRCQDAVDEIKKITQNENVFQMELDLMDFDSIKHCAEEFESKKIPLHILVNNAGIMGVPYGETKQGFESQFGTNHLGHFLLTNLLFESLKRSGQARIVNVSSEGHKLSGINFADIKGKDTWYPSTFGKWKAYGQSKSANILFALEADKRWKQYGIRSYSLHPGAIYTNLGNNLKTFEKGLMAVASIFMKSVEQGAATSVYCATAPEIAEQGGKYYLNSNLAVANPHAFSEEAATKLWQLSEELTGVKV